MMPEDLPSVAPSLSHSLGYRPIDAELPDCYISIGSTGLNEHIHLLDCESGAVARPIALIIGVTGQDGSYLAELLLEKDYVVHGIKRRSSSFNTGRVDHLYADRHDISAGALRFTLHYGDLTDTTSLVRVLKQVQPQEIYNLGAQSHVAVSFEAPEYTADSDALGTLPLLEALRILDMERSTRFYQGSTSERIGKTTVAPQNETTPFQPCSPYASAK